MKIEKKNFLIEVYVGDEGIDGSDDDGDYDEYFENSLICNYFHYKLIGKDVMVYSVDYVNDVVNDQTLDENTKVDRLNECMNRYTVRFQGKDVRLKVIGIAKKNVATEGYIDTSFIDYESNIRFITTKNETGVFFRIKNMKKDKSSKEKPSNEKSICFGGYTKEVEKVKSIMKMILKLDDEINQNMKMYYHVLQKVISLPKAILIDGRSGIGKNHFINYIVQEIKQSSSYVMKVKQFLLKPSDLIYKEYGRNELYIKSLFQEAKSFASYSDSSTKYCSIISIDQLEIICSTSKDDSEQSFAFNDQARKRVIHTICNEIDLISDKNSLDSSLPICVIGITNDLQNVDKTLRRSGRFDIEIELPTPTEHDRELIIKSILKESNSLDSVVQIDQLIQYIVSKTHGYVAGDLKSLCQEAVFSFMMRRKQQMHKTSKEDSLLESFNKLSIEQRKEGIGKIDFDEAFKHVKASSIREIMIEVPKVKWEDIGGNEDVKQLLKESVEWQLKHKDLFEKMGIRAPKGILLYGAPGCSKTLMAKALATESSMNFLAVKGPELFSKWVGESEKAVREVFRKAQAAKPTIIFFDEIDGLAVERGVNGSSGVHDRVLSQLLNELDGIKKLEGVTILAATNRPDIIDKALLRPGRFDRMVYIKPPDSVGRKDIFKIHIMKQKFYNLSNIDLEKLGDITDGYSGAEIAAVCQEAAYMALQDDINVESVKQEYYEKAIQQIKPRISRGMIEFYEQFEKKHMFTK